MDKLAQGARDIMLEAIRLAREEAEKEEARLGRRLTDAEVTQIARMVDRQLRTAIVMAKLS